MEKFEAPKSLLFESNNLLGEWKKWKKHFEFYLAATEADTKSDKIKSSILLSCIGEKGREIFETFEFPAKENEADPDPSMLLANVLAKFEGYCNPRKNITIMRHKFFSYRQDEGQSFGDFLTQLKSLSQDCEFETLKDSLIKDMIICGVTDNKLRERMLREADLDLNKAIKLGQAAEETKKHAQQLKVEREHTVYKIQKSPPWQQDRSNRETINNCKFCSYSHVRGKCPAYGKHCNNCNKLNHFSKCCRSKRTAEVDLVNTQIGDPQENTQEPQNAFVIEAISNNSNRDNQSNLATKDKVNDDYIDNSKVISSVKYCDDNLIATVDETRPADWLIGLEANESIVEFKLDTGAQVNVLPKYVYDKLTNCPKLFANNASLSGYGDNELKVCGRCVMSIKVRGKLYKVLFYVVDTDWVPLLGLSSCIRLNLIKRVDEVQSNDRTKSQIGKEYSDLFNEIGTLNRIYHMELEENAVPKISPTKLLPFSMHDAVHSEIERMVQMGVVEKIDENEPSEWLNTLVVVEKPDGSVRLCLDPRNLNKVVKREHYQMPTAEAIMAKMKGAKYFSKLDASSGYWQIQVDQESSKYLAFMTPWGRYRFLRLPFGLHSASEIFHSEVSQIINGMEGVENSQDDIIIWGRTEEEHNERLFQVLERIRASGLKLNFKK